MIAEPESMSAEILRNKVNFNIETHENILTTETRRPLLTLMEEEKLQTLEEESKAPTTAKKKILLNNKVFPVQNAEPESQNELDFDDGLLMLQKTFNLRTSDILQNLKVKWAFKSDPYFFISIKTTKAIKYYSRATMTKQEKEIIKEN